MMDEEPEHVFRYRYVGGLMKFASWWLFQL